MITLNHIRFSHTTPMYFDLQVPEAQKVAVVGASGAGKSTLLNLIAGFTYADSGELLLDGNNHTYTKPYERPVSMLFQHNNLFNHLAVAQNIALGLASHLKLSATQQQAVAEVAEKVGLSDYLSRLPAQLSGGQQQRVALARCLLRERPVLLLDEPFSALDKALRKDMLGLLETLCEEKQLTLLMVTHQAEELDGFVDRTIEVAHGTIIV